MDDILNPGDVPLVVRALLMAIVLQKPEKVLTVDLATLLERPTTIKLTKVGTVITLRLLDENGNSFN